VKKRAIPNPPLGDRFAGAVKENLEILMGQRGGKVTPLPDDATLADVVAKVNELLTRLQ